jgi:hypothetical protein
MTQHLADLKSVYEHRSKYRKKTPGRSKLNFNVRNALTLDRKIQSQKKHRSIVDQP